MKTSKICDVVLVGGGSGISAIAAMLRDEPGLRLSLIPSTFDDGGHSGDLRKAYGIGAVGDIRKCIQSLADPAMLRAPLGKKFRYRDKTTNVSRGNLLILDRMRSGDSADWSLLPQAIDDLSASLKTKGRIIPVSLDIATMVGFPYGADYVKGQRLTDIYASLRSGIMSVSLLPQPRLYERAAEAIGKADVILFCPGSFWTSIMVHLSVVGFREAVVSAAEKGTRIAMMVNPVEPLQDGSLKTSDDHVAMLAKVLFLRDERRIDAAFAQAAIPPYATEERLSQDLGLEAVRFEPSGFAVANIAGDYVDWQALGKPRFSPLIARAFADWAQSI